MCGQQVQLVKKRTDKAVVKLDWVLLKNNKGNFSSYNDLSKDQRNRLLGLSKFSLKQAKFDGTSMNEFFEKLNQELIRHNNSPIIYKAKDEGDTIEFEVIKSFDLIHFLCYVCDQNGYWLNLDKSGKFKVIPNTNTFDGVSRYPSTGYLLELNP